MRTMNLTCFFKIKTMVNCMPVVLCFYITVVVLFFYCTLSHVSSLFKSCGKLELQIEIGLFLYA